MSMRRPLICLSLLLLFSACTVPALAGPKRLLLISHKNYGEYCRSWLKPLGLAVDLWDKTNKAPQWRNRGWVLPDSSVMGAYDAVMVGPNSNLTPDAKDQVTRYLRNGGIMFFLYTSLMKAKQCGDEIGYGLTGFDTLYPLHLSPYPKSGPMTHHLVYRGKLGKQEKTFKTLYAVYAQDLADAEALIVNRDRPELALATAAPVGKGLFIFYGSDRKDVLIDLLKYCSLLPQTDGNCPRNTGKNP